MHPDAIISYLLKSVISSGILAIYYWLFLRNKKLHRFNRFYLLLAILFSLGFPLLKFNWFVAMQPEYKPLTRLLSLFNADTSRGNGFQYTWEYILIAGSVLVSVLLLVTLLLKIFWIYRMKRTHPYVKMSGFDFIETELKQAPFSFLDNLFWRKGILFNDENGKMIFTHELTHIRERHTYDKLFSQFTSCIFWMNPFYWIIQKELSLIHEFIADEKSLEGGDAGSFARMLLGSYNEGKYLDPLHFFFQSPISRRLYMINSREKDQFSRWRKIWVLPLILLTVFLFSFTFISPPNKEAVIQKQKDEWTALEKQRFVVKKAAEQKQLEQKIQTSVKKPKGVL